MFAILLLWNCFVFCCGCFFVLCCVFWFCFWVVRLIVFSLFVLFVGFVLSWLFLFVFIVLVWLNVSLTLLIGLIVFSGVLLFCLLALIFCSCFIVYSFDVGLRVFVDSLTSITLILCCAWFVVVWFGWWNFLFGLVFWLLPTLDLIFGYFWICLFWLIVLLWMVGFVQWLVFRVAGCYALVLCFCLIIVLMWVVLCFFSYACDY